MLNWGSKLEQFFNLENLPILERNKQRIAVELALFIVIAGIGYNVLYISLGYPQAVIGSITSLVATAVNLLVFKLSRNFKIFSFTQLLIILFSVYLCNIFWVALLMQVAWHSVQFFLLLVHYYLQVKKLEEFCWLLCYRSNICGIFRISTHFGNKSGLLNAKMVEYNFFCCEFYPHLRHYIFYRRELP